MRGSPLLRALLAFLAISLVGWPLARLTRPAAAAPAPSPTTTGTGPAAEPLPATVHLALSFTTLPRRVTLWHSGKEIWSTDVTNAEMEHDLTLSWPREGVDLRFVIDWPTDAPLAAARVQITS